MDHNTSRLPWPVQRRGEAGGGGGEAAALGDMASTHTSGHTESYPVARGTNEGEILVGLSPDQLQHPLGESACHLCGKTFHGRYQKYNLKRHLSIHAGEKPFLCMYCSHRTNQKYNMQQHLLVCRHRPQGNLPQDSASDVSLHL